MVIINYQQFPSHDGAVQAGLHTVTLPTPMKLLLMTSSLHEVSHGDIVQAGILDTTPNPICESGALAHSAPPFLDIVSVVQPPLGSSK